MTAPMLSPTGCGLTVLHARGRRLCKTIRADGTLIPYDSARTFDLHHEPVADLAALADLLRRLLSCPDAAVVRGAILDPARTRRVRRLLHADAETGDAPTLREVPRRWLALDVDGLDLPPGTDPRALTGAASPVPGVPSATGRPGTAGTPQFSRVSPVSPVVPGGNERGEPKTRSLTPLIARLRAAAPLPLFPEADGGEGVIPRTRKEEFCRHYTRGKGAVIPRTRKEEGGGDGRGQRCARAAFLARAAEDAAAALAVPDPDLAHERAEVAAAQAAEARGECGQPKSEADHRAALAGFLAAGRQRPPAWADPASLPPGMR